MDAQKLQTETIKQSKKEIEETLGSVEYAFRKMYDGFFQNTALDVSSDISVMNTMFARETAFRTLISKISKYRNRRRLEKK